MPAGHVDRWSLWVGRPGVRDSRRAGAGRGQLMNDYDKEPLAAHQL